MVEVEAFVVILRPKRSIVLYTSTHFNSISTTFLLTFNGVFAPHITCIKIDLMDCKVQLLFLHISLIRLYSGIMQIFWKIEFVFSLLIYCHLENFYNLYLVRFNSSPFQSLMYPKLKLASVRVYIKCFNSYKISLLLIIKTSPTHKTVSFSMLFQSSKLPNPKPLYINDTNIYGENDVHSVVCIFYTKSIQCLGYRDRKRWTLD